MSKQRKYVALDAEVKEKLEELKRSDYKLMFLRKESDLIDYLIDHYKSFLSGDPIADPINKSVLVNKFLNAICHDDVKNLIEKKLLS